MSNPFEEFEQAQVRPTLSFGEPEVQEETEKQKSTFTTAALFCSMG